MRVPRCDYLRTSCPYWNLSKSLLSARDYLDITRDIRAVLPLGNCSNLFYQKTGGFSLIIGYRRDNILFVF